MTKPKKDSPLTAKVSTNPPIDDLLEPTPGRAAIDHLNLTIENLKRRIADDAYLLATFAAQVAMLKRAIEAATKSKTPPIA